MMKKKEDADLWSKSLKIMSKSLKITCKSFLSLTISSGWNFGRIVKKMEVLMLKWWSTSLITMLTSRLRTSPGMDHTGPALSFADQSSKYGYRSDA